MCVCASSVVFLLFIKEFLGGGEGASERTYLSNDDEQSLTQLRSQIVHQVWVAQRQLQQQRQQAEERLRAMQQQQEQQVWIAEWMNGFVCWCLGRVVVQITSKSKNT